MTEAVPFEALSFRVRERFCVEETSRTYRKRDDPEKDVG